jgi:hypothetical protein
MQPLCTRADVEAVYMPSNVAKWADLDGDGDAADIDARIDRYCEVATADFYDRLRGGPYAVPLSFGDDASGISTTNTVASFAGVLLYEANGVMDFNPETGQPQHRLHFQRKQYEDFCSDLRSGRRRIDAERVCRSCTAPEVVK